MPRKKVKTPMCAIPPRPTPKPGELASEHLLRTIARDFADPGFWAGSERCLGFQEWLDAGRPESVERVAVAS